MVDISEQARLFEQAKKLKGEDKLQSFKKIRASLQQFFRECAADFGISYERVVDAKKLSDRVDTAIGRALGKE